MKWTDAAMVLAGVGILATACGAPTAPSGGAFPPGTTAQFGVTTPPTRGNLAITSMGVSDAGQGAQGVWQYKVNVYLREIGGVDTTLTNIQVEALMGSRSLAPADVTPVLSVSANSRGDTAFIFTADTHVEDLTTLKVGLNVHFRDANGFTGSVSEAFSGFGAWDY